jgi:hypothetical protein
VSMCWMSSSLCDKAMFKSLMEGRDDFIEIDGRKKPVNL